MQSSLYEEQQERERLETELMELRAFAEAVKHRRRDSDSDSLSANSHAAAITASGGGGLTMPDSHGYSNTAQHHHQQQQQQLISQAFAGHHLMAGAAEQAMVQRSLKMDSYAYIRLPTTSKRKTPQWSRVSMHLTGTWLVFYKIVNGQAGSIPTVQIATQLIHHARRVTSADIRSADEKQIPLIFQILYDNETAPAGAAANGNGTSHSRRGSMIDLNASSVSSQSSSTAAAAAAVANIDKSLWRRHDLVEVRFHTTTSCDLCRLGCWNIFRPPPAVECLRCRMKFHVEHRDKGELPQCKREWSVV
jgi:hypothetical protein